MIMKRHLHVFLVALLWVIALPVSADEASVTFPETATYISLTNCPNLASINVPKNVYRLVIFPHSVVCDT